MCCPNRFQVAATAWWHLIHALLLLVDALLRFLRLLFRVQLLLFRFANALLSFGHLGLRVADHSFGVVRALARGKDCASTRSTSL